MNSSKMSNQTSCSSENNLAYTVVIQLLTFSLVFGLAGSVDFVLFKQRFKQKGIYIGLFCQFFILPLIGFATVAVFDIPDPLKALLLLIIMSSPGGSYSNWWCSLFNADLALSVAMTTVSTICSMFMLPINILLYVNLAFKSLPKNACDPLSPELCTDVSVDFSALGLTLGVVISAIVLGLIFGYNYPRYQDIANKVGNFCGLTSIILGLVFSQNSGDPPLEQPAVIWFACLVPLQVALWLAFFVSGCFGLPSEQRVAIAIETAYQNTGIAIAYGVTLGCEGRKALVVPVIYGGFEALCFGLFMVFSWKMGWTYAPASDGSKSIVGKFLYMGKVIRDNYQPLDHKGNDSSDASEGKEMKPKTSTAQDVEKTGETITPAGVATGTRNKAPKPPQL